MPFPATRKSLLSVAVAAAVAGPTTISTHSTLAAKCVSHWKLDEATGNSRADSKGSNTLSEAGTTAGVGSATGKIGDAVDLVSADADRLERADTASLSFADVPFAFSAWVYIDGGSSERGIVAKGTATGAASMEYNLAVSSAGALTFRVSNSASATTVTSGTTLSTATWYFIYAYHDPTANEIGVGVDGGTPTTAACSHGCWDGGSQFRLGRQVAGGYLDGRIDSVTVWNDILTTGEQSDLYNAGAGLDY